MKDRHWTRIHEELDRSGWAVLEGLLDDRACTELVSMYERDDLFRKRIVMERHGYGQGEYKYFAYPLPSRIAGLRGSLYERLVPVANDWQQALRRDVRFPATHQDFLQRCHDAGQQRPTPLLLRYAAGDFNHLHQDLYGEHVFPLQVAALLHEPGRDFTGGEFLLTEQRPRRQARATVVPLRRGDAVAFAVHQRPAAGRRGPVRATVRHGVSEVLSGERMTAGIIFHDSD